MLLTARTNARHARRSAVVLALLIGATACSAANHSGSVHETAGQSGSATTAPVALPGPSVASARRASTPGATSQGGGNESGLLGVSSSATTNAPALGTHTETVGGRTVLVGHGITPTRIEIGIQWLDAAGSASAISAVGGKSSASGNVKKDAQSVVDYINAHGGVAGRQIAPVFYQANIQNLTTESGRSQEAQSMCASFTQDHHVFAMVFLTASNDNVLDCAQRTQTPILTNSLGQMIDDQRYAQMANYIYDPSDMTVDQRERMLADQMVQRGLLTPSSKLGLLIEGNSPMFKGAADRTLIPELRKYHIPVASEAIYPDFIESAWSTYVLQFQQAGVTNVYFGDSEGSGWAAVFFMEAAENQHYFPKYEFATDHGFSFVAGSAPADQLVNVQGEGWVQSRDLSGSDATQPLTSTGAVCAQIMKSVGEPPVNGPPLCEPLFLLQKGLGAATDLTPGGFATAVEALKDSWPPVFVRRALFGPGHHLGAVEIRDVGFDRSCTCFKYTSAPRGIR